MHPNRVQAIQIVASRTPVDPVNAPARISEVYGSQVFSLKEMEHRLPKSTYESVRKVIHNGEDLSPDLASQLSEAIKAWALSKGATHFTHWFQPLTGLTAEKHDSFITYDKTGGVIEKFSAAQLIQSEPDASSFPSGGMRSTFEARGYTAWDVSSPVFIVEHSGSKILCIPSVFVSYTGHALDTKTALVRSTEVISDAALTLLKEMGDTKTRRVVSTLGCEQEYFLIDRAFGVLRPDLLLTGRTLLGADMTKGQQLEDHYFGSIPSRVQAFMVDAESELYRLGVPVKTRHNEVAPSQFETAPIFEEANVAADHNMLTMEVLQRTALKHNFMCLLHEKPFAGINGSGKHNNWALATDLGENLLEPGTTPHENFRFLAVLSCILDALHRNQVSLRAAIASHGNDHRLGANEAPPAIISAFLGTALTQIIETLEKGGDLSKLSAEKALIEFGLNRLPKLPKDNTDRNRTSPFAFTGNKFEFRAVGSSQSCSFPVAILNVGVAISMKEFSQKLKETLKKGAASTESAVLAVAKEFFLRSKSIRFEGNGYSEEWRKEARSRGLYEFLTTPEALAAFSKKEHHADLIQSGVFREDEVEALAHIKLERYSKHLEIEARTMLSLCKLYVLPAAEQHAAELSGSVAKLEAVGMVVKQQKLALKALVSLIETLYDKEALLENVVNEVGSESDPLKSAAAFGSRVSPAMTDLRQVADELGRLIPEHLWALPKYGEMLFLR
jgi:glutamine synthetase